MDKAREIRTIIKYGAVGVLNTAVTALTFFVLRYFDVQVDLANFLSYVVGILNSFVCNKLFVFRDRKQGWLRQGAVFFVGAGLCWALQWVAFRLLMLVWDESIAYLIAMLVYPVLNYLYNRLITFRNARKTD